MPKMRLPGPQQITVFDSPAERKIKSLYNSLLGDEGASPFDVSDIAPTPIAAAAKIPAGFAKLLGRLKGASNRSKMVPFSKGKEIWNTATDRLAKYYDEAVPLARRDAAPVWGPFGPTLDRDSNIAKAISAVADGHQIEPDLIARLKKSLSPEKFARFQTEINNAKIGRTLPRTSAHDYTKSGANQTRREFLVRQSGLPRRWAKDEVADLNKSKWLSKHGYQLGNETVGEMLDEWEVYRQAGGGFGSSGDKVWDTYLKRRRDIGRKLGGGRLPELLGDTAGSVQDTVEQAARSPIVSKAKERAALRSRSLARQKETPGIFRRMLGKFGKGQ